MRCRLEHIDRSSLTGANRPTDCQSEKNGRFAGMFGNPVCKLLARSRIQWARERACCDPQPHFVPVCPSTCFSRTM